MFSFGSALVNLASLVRAEDEHHVPTRDTSPTVLRLFATLLTLPHSGNFGMVRREIPWFGGLESTGRVILQTEQ